MFANCVGVLASQCREPRDGAGCGWSDQDVEDGVPGGGQMDRRRLSCAVGSGPYPGLGLGLTS